MAVPLDTFVKDIHRLYRVCGCSCLGWMSSVLKLSFDMRRWPTEPEQHVFSSPTKYVPPLPKEKGILPKLSASELFTQNVFPGRKLDLFACWCSVSQTPSVFTNSCWFLVKLFCGFASLKAFLSHSLLTKAYIGESQAMMGSGADVCYIAPYPGQSRMGTLAVRFVFFHGICLVYWFIPFCCVLPRKPLFARV